MSDDAREEAERFRWIESEKAGYDLGDEAIRRWVALHWPGFVPRPGARAPGRHPVLAGDGARRLRRAAARVPRHARSWSARSSPGSRPGPTT